MECNTDEHSSAVMLAWVAVLVYPIGLLLATALLLGYHKAEVQGTSPPTKLSKAIHFLYGPYKPDAYYWELVEMARRFLLVGIAVIIQPGTIVQLTFATLLSLIYNIVQHEISPYAGAADNFIGAASSFSLTVLFFSCILLKLGLLLELDDVRVRLSAKLLEVRRPRLPTLNPRYLRISHSNDAV